MSERYTREDLLAKVEWECGLEEAINGYGLTSDMLPEDAPDEIVQAWKRIEATKADVDAIETWLYADGSEAA